ncbi:MAG TPA: transaldolase [Thermoplasmatales archaeon]|nr:transaldolase [Thermoplasmatales archaeon]
MQIFVDTADLEEIKEAKSWGIVDGVTTNPSLIKKAVEKLKDKGMEMSMEEYIGEICRAVDGPVSLEVKGIKSEDMVREATILYEKFNHINNNVVIKIPISTAMNEGEELFEGVKAIKELSEKGIPTNATLVMTPCQALLAAKAGASYVSPFLGRVDDYIRERLGMKFNKWDIFDGKLLRSIEEKRREQKNSYDEASWISLSDEGIYDGVELVESIIKIYRAYNYKTKIIAASVRNAMQVRKVAEMGVDIATIPFKVIKEMITHYKTMEGMHKFTEDVVDEYRAIFEQ